jgi:Arc/MetJ-type ribon-helix-helix transcriptional regulator
MEQTNENTRTWLWNIQVTEGMNNAVERAILTDSHVSKSEFIRDAVREKLRSMKIL